MASKMSNEPFTSLTLDRIVNLSQQTFVAPSKLINNGDDLDFFFTSTAYGELRKWLLQLNRAMFPSRNSQGNVMPSIIDASQRFPDHVQHLRALLEDLATFVQQAPPDTGPRRFGNVAFRKWYQLAEENAVHLLRTHLEGIGFLSSSDPIDRQSSMVEELKAYLLGSLGSSQRLDYGTGHELSFLAFLGCLWKLGMFEVGEERAIVIGVIQPYLELVRKLILTYTLEPAGSHGVWGLDDHSFLPYIFGSAQFGPAIDDGDYLSAVPTEGSLPTAPSPSSVTNKAMVMDFKDSNMYFSAIQFIYDVKKGPFWEHSPVLYDISGIKDGWGKINKGMLKMYAAETLGKFPVVQHFPFGGMFPWERDPAAGEQMAMSAHQQQYTAPMQSKDVPPAPQMTPATQSITGVPSTRAPWASSPSTGRLPNTISAATAAPWASTQRQPPGKMQSTTAPWAKK